VWAEAVAAAAVQIRVAVVAEDLVGKIVFPYLQVHHIQ
jgi:hypothetical protein